jgi:hypothetical protein
MPSQIVNDAGFDPKILGKQRIDNIAKRFKKMALRSEGFMDTRKGNSSCISTIEPIEPTTDNLTTEEQLERLKHKIKYLEQENDWLKKIEYLNRQAESKEKLKNKELRQSMSRRGNCWDNAPQESFFGHMKDEIHLERCNTYDELCNEIDNYMDYYNNERYQWELAKLAPNQYAAYLITGKHPLNE